MYVPPRFSLENYSGPGKTLGTMDGTISGKSYRFHKIAGQIEAEAKTWRIMLSPALSPTSRCRPCMERSRPNSPWSSRKKTTSGRHASGHNHSRQHFEGSQLHRIVCETAEAIEINKRV